MRTILLTFCLISFAPEISYSATSTYKTSTGIIYTAKDVQQAVQAVLRIPTDDTFILYSETFPADELPAWDPIAHYEGPKQLPDGRIAYAFAVSDRYDAALQDLAHARHVVAVAIASAALMAVMDSGRAGSRWKTFFDHAAAADAKLASSVHDRFANGRALVAHLADTQTIVYSSIGGSGATITDRAGNPLTENIDYGSGLIGAARLGIGNARVMELFEYPTELKRASAQAFVDDWFKHFSTIFPTGGMRASLTKLRPLLVVTPSANLGSNQHRFGQAMYSLTSQLDGDLDLAFAVGLEATEARYNATVIRHVDEDNQLRDVLARTNSLDASLPRLREMRAKLGAIPSGDWQQVSSVSSEIIQAILAGR